MIFGEKNINLKDRGSLSQLTIDELLWYASIRRKDFSFKECLIEYILKIHNGKIIR